MNLCVYVYALMQCHFQSLITVLLLLLMCIYMCSLMLWALIDTNLNTIFYAHIEDSPTIRIYSYIRHYLHARGNTLTITHNDCTSRNWVLKLAGVEILWEEEGFQFGFKRWQGWAVSNSKVLWEWISFGLCGSVIFSLCRPYHRFLCSHHWCWLWHNGKEN